MKAVERVRPEHVTVKAVGDWFQWPGPNGKLPGPWMFTAEWNNGALLVKVKFELDPGIRPRVTKVKIRPVDVVNGTVTTEAARAIPYTSIVQVALGKAFPGDRYRAWRVNIPPRKTGRELAPDFIAHMRTLVEYATALGDDKAEVVADVYDIPVPTAQRYATQYVRRT